MPEDISWFEMAEQFEAVDPWGLLELHWIYRKETGEYLYSVRFSGASPYIQASEPQRTKPTLVRERFTALCARAGRKMGLISGTADDWFAQVSVGNRITSFEGDVEHPKTKEVMHVMTGTITNIAQKAAALCYRIDSSPETHEVLPPESLPPSTTGSKRANVKRAAWLKERLHERGWDHNTPEKFNGPEHRTVQRILNGEPVGPSSLRKLVTALNSYHNAKRVMFSEIPND
ncbi:MAG TPA: hypothetical protein VG273_05410 [Bryobacteraceae bacterium]|jgi:hypothetical protein|nr:hypothetical protein [Bryobacteraceae bacterium]